METTQLVGIGRTYPVGPQIVPGGGVHFRVWAPNCASLEVLLEDPQAPGIELEKEEGGYFSGLAERAGPGALYWFRLDGKAIRKDPASFFQPQGPFGPSQVFSSQYRWSHQSWPGVHLKGQILYEMHVGTFTPQGTWAAAMEYLPRLAQDGITTIEMMPVHQFPGGFSWGYDGVDLFAPACQYGTPDDLRGFVDRAHAVGLGVLLDVVYNHFGPEGCFLREFSADYFSRQHAGEWGDPINYDGPNAGPVRDFVAANAAYWVGEFRFDGLRLDATQQIFDTSGDPIVRRIGREARAAAPNRSIIVIAENDQQDPDLARPEDCGGYGLDAVWNDDFHHASQAALTGHRGGYLRNYQGAPQEFISAAKRGYLYQGQINGSKRDLRGRPSLDIAPMRFVHFLQNHDQIANTGMGMRCHETAQPGQYRALTALFLLMPQTPMLFQGQEYGASSPFVFFADHEPGLAANIRRGRGQLLSQFSNLASPEIQEILHDPADPSVFALCKLNPLERDRNREHHALHVDLIRLRRSDPVFSEQGHGALDGAVLSDRAFLLRWFSMQGERLILVNLGTDLALSPAPEPLLAPTRNGRWKMMWSSESPCYGGSGTPELQKPEGWQIPGCGAFVLADSLPS